MRPIPLAAPPAPTRAIAAAALVSALSTPLAPAASQPPAAHATPAAAQDSILAARLDSVVRARVAADSFSGVVLVARGASPIYQTAAGMADRERGRPIGLDTRFSLGSVDKYFARIAIRQLEQAGKLRLSDRVGQHLPDYPNARVRAEVTVGHLYHMTAGLPELVNERFGIERRNLRTTDDYLALFATDTLVFAPGTRTEYCNSCYVVLGKIVERLSGMSWAAYARAHIFEPAGMTRTGYVDMIAGAPDLAVGYTGRDPYWMPAMRAGTTARRPNTDILPRFGGPDGMGQSTAGDLLKLSTALLAGRLLDAERLDSLLGPRFRRPEGGRLLTSGWTGGFPGVSTYYNLYSTGHTVIVLSNYDAPSADRVSGRATRLIQEVTGARLNPEIRRLDPASARARRARRLAELLAAGDRAGAEAYLRPLATEAYAASPGLGSALDRLTARVAPAGTFRVDVFEEEGRMTVVWLRNAAGRYTSLIVMEDEAGRVTRLGLDSRPEPEPGA